MTDFGLEMTEIGLPSRPEIAWAAKAKSLVIAFQQICGGVRLTFSQLHVVRN